MQEPANMPLEVIRQVEEMKPAYEIESGHLGHEKAVLLRRRMASELCFEKAIDTCVDDVPSSRASRRSM